MRNRDTKNWENMTLANYRADNPYEIPELDAVHTCDTKNWIGFKFARSMSAEERRSGIHFFLDDYQFKRIWEQPHRYTEMLARFPAVMTPDFSVYSDFPKALKIWNHFRKHWLGRYWQDRGMTVIPTITWSDETSYEWCFDGEPEGSIVAVSSVGTQKTEHGKKLFLDGYREMMHRLKPEKVFVYGIAPEGLTGNVERIAPYWETVEKRAKKKE